MAQLLFSQLSRQVLGACFAVHNALGPGLVTRFACCSPMQPGLLESAYEGALAIEFQQQGLAFERQVVYPVYYKGHMAGAYVADMVVAGKIILELKSVQSLGKFMEAQLLNYLRLSKVPVGYLVDFNGERVVWRRFVYGGAEYPKALC